MDPRILEGKKNKETTPVSRPNKNEPINRGVNRPHNAVPPINVMDPDGNKHGLDLPKSPIVGLPCHEHKALPTETHDKEDICPDVIPP